jgi:hypothetical protein
MSDERSKERDETPCPEPVLLDGLCFVSIPWGLARGLGQNGGLRAAVDPDTGEERWWMKVYDVSYDPDREGDKQDHFIASLRALDAHHLEVESERGWRFKVDVRDRSVSQLGSEPA